MQSFRLCLAIVLLLLSGALGASASAAARVELEIFTDERTPLTGPQEWLRQLSQVGLAHLQIRARQPEDKIAIEVAGTESDPVYRVTGALNAGNELLLPGARFSLSEAARVVQWVKDLAKRGPPSQANQKLAFGLHPRKLEQVRTDLGQPVGFSTAGMDRGAVVERIGRKVQLPLAIAAGQREALQEDKVTEELAGLSCGTALACVLRPAGLCLVPRETDDGKLQYEIIKSKPDLEVWPVGWPPERPDRDLLPDLFELRNVNVQGVAVTVVLTEVGSRLKLPVLMDHNALARHGVEPEKVLVSLPKSRTSYSLLFRKVLFQARLKHELRVDEAGHPFLWVTTIKPL
jgi:hypothetical protein